MISKIIRVKNVGKLDVSHALELDKLTVIYAENAMGKTTLSAIFRSLAEAEGRHILERSTLGCSDAPDVALILDSAKACFSGGRWNCAPPDLEIFDATFVEENVYRGCYVEHEHKKNLHGFVMGAEGVRLAKRVDELDAEIRSKTREIGATQSEIQARIIGQLPFDKFLTLSLISDVDDQIKSKTRELEALKKPEQIRQGQFLEEMSLPHIDLSTAESILARTIRDVSQEAARLVTEHLSSFDDGHGNAWINQGLAYVKDATCPFCGQSVEGIKLIRAYEDYFGAAYSDLEREVGKLATDVPTQFSVANLDKIRNIKDANDGRVLFWTAYVSGNWPKISLEDIERVWQALGNELQELANAKKAEPLRPQRIDEDLRKTYREFQEIRVRVEHYCQTVGSANGLIEEQKRKISAEDIGPVEARLVVLRNSAVRWDSQVQEWCDKYGALLDEKIGLERDKVETKRTLDEHTKDVFATYQSDTNRFLNNFGADFSIARLGQGYTGGRPHCDYCLSINEEDVALKDSDNSACFRNTLSSGDRSTLAFAFFLARLTRDDFSKKVIVLDDPLSSLDGHRRHCTASEVSDILEKATQVILLSHDPYFLKKCLDRTRVPRKTHAIVRTSKGSKIAPWDPEKEVQSGYYRNYVTMAEFVADGTAADKLAVARCIRPLLEENLRVRFPTEFRPKDWLGEFINKIRAADAGSALACLKSKLREIEEVNEYSKQFHHAGNAATTTPLISDPELKTYAARTLKLIPGILSAGAE